MNSVWKLPENDPWSTPFARVLLDQVDLFPGASVLDIAAGGGIPAFHIADHVGREGNVLAIDIHPHQIMRARSIQGSHLPWLKFEVGDMRKLPDNLPRFDRITGNLSFMFFRPDRVAALKQLIRFLKPGGQIVLTFPSRGTFDSLWNRADREMESRGLEKERTALAEYIQERPAADQSREWLEALGMERVTANQHPLEIATGRGKDFLNHPLLRAGFLDDLYECFEDPGQAEEFMTLLSQDIPSFIPLVAQRCALSAWMPGSNEKE